MCLMNVLVIDDDAACRESLRLLLQAEGCLVQAVSGPEELDPRGIFVPDVLIADVSLSRGESGLAVAKQMLSEWPEMRVILISGYAAPSIAKKGSSHQVSHFLGKPFSPEELLGAVMGFEESLTRME